MEKLSNPQVTIETIKKYEFAFQKKFGQNFLIDAHVINKIISAADITKDDCVLEIGPGIGTMTQYLAESAGQVVAVEIDKNLLPILDETLAEYDNVTIINDDILKVDINKIVEERNGGRPIKVVANLPYYITTPIIMGLFEKHVPLLGDGHGAEGGCGPHAGGPGNQGLRSTVPGSSVLCRAVYSGKCSAKLLYTETGCGLSGHQTEQIPGAAGQGEGRAAHVPADKSII